MNTYNKICCDNCGLHFLVEFNYQPKQGLSCPRCLWRNNFIEEFEVEIAPRSKKGTEVGLWGNGSTGGI